MMATDTMAIYRDSRSQERNAVLISNYSLVVNMGAYPTSLVCAMISSIRGDIVEKKRTKNR